MMLMKIALVAKFWNQFPSFESFASLYEKSNNWTSINLIKKIYMCKKILTLMRGIVRHAFWGEKRNKRYALSRSSDEQYKSNRKVRIGRKGSKINLVKPSGQQINEQINTHSLL